MAISHPVSVLNVVGDKQFDHAIKFLLKEAGISQLFSTDDTNGIFDIINGASIDILLIQDVPPDVDAAEICRTVRTSAKSPNIALPVVIALPAPSMKRVIEATNAGVNEILTYPLSPKKLLERLASAYNDRREFIEADHYVGPDRRALQNQKKYDGPFRRVNEDATCSPINPASSAPRGVVWE